MHVNNAWTERLHCNLTKHVRQVPRLTSVFVACEGLLGPDIYSASNRNEYQKQRVAQPVRRADSLAAICEPIV
jgi:hypothetical protein